MSYYSETVLEHFYCPRNARKLGICSRGFSGKVDGTGPFIVIYLRSNGRYIEEIGFQTYGCAPAIACGSFLTEYVDKMDLLLAEVYASDPNNLIKGLGGLPENKRHCATMACEALIQAIHQFKNKGHSG